MKKVILDLKGNKVEEITLSDDVFKAEPNDSVTAQYLRTYFFNQRVGTAKTKTKAEVAGGGAKPWRQKGTGRARAGSTRSPIWAHGGVAHGPLPKSWRLDLPKKMRKLAMTIALSSKESLGGVSVVDDFSMNKISSSDFLKIVKDLGLKGKILIVWGKKNENTMKSAGNLQNIRMAFCGALNAHDVISSNSILFDKDAIVEINKRFKK